MMYYRVKPEYDNAPRFVYVGSQHHIKQDYVLIGNELYTQRERNRIANSSKYFDMVEISKRKVYSFFGVRFENKEA